MHFTKDRLRRFIRKGLLYLVGLSVVLGARGALIARAIDGCYPPRNLAEDVLSLAALMAAFHVVYFALNRFLSMIAGPRTFPRLAGAGFVRVFFVVFIVFPGLLSFIQLHPQRIRATQNPSIAGLKFEEFEFESGDQTLRGWFLPGNADAKFAIVLVHGLNANKQNFLYPAKLLHDLGLPVAIFDLPAHGDSDGRLFTFGIRESEAVHAASIWLKQRLPGKKIGGLGFSAGAAALLGATAKYYEFDRIVLDSPLISVERTAKNKFLWVFGPLDEIAWQSGRLWTKMWAGVDLGGFDANMELSRLDPKRVMVIFGESDSIFPLEETKRFLASGGGEIQSWSVSNADHIEAIRCPEYAGRLAKFFEAETPIMSTLSDVGPKPDS